MEDFKGLKEKSSSFTADTVEIESAILQELLQASRNAIRYNVSLHFDESPEGNSSVTIKPIGTGNNINEFLQNLEQDN